MPNSLAMSRMAPDQLTATAAPECRSTPAFSQCISAISRAWLPCPAQRGTSVRAIDEEEIRVRTLYIMVNEAATVLEEGIAQRASDIDVVWLHGYGWPRVTGGLLNWANEVGLDTIVAGLERYTSALAPGTTIAPLLRACAKAGIPLERH